MDLRMLSLLHLLQDKEGFLEELRRLQQSEFIDQDSWAQVRKMSNELGLGKMSTMVRFQTNIEKCGRVLRPQTPTRRSDRRRCERRTLALPWVGTERRKGERRQSLRG